MHYTRFLRLPHFPLPGYSVCAIINIQGWAAVCRLTLTQEAGWELRLFTTLRAPWVSTITGTHWVLRPERARPVRSFKKKAQQPPSLTSRRYRPLQQEVSRLLPSVTKAWKEDRLRFPADDLARSVKPRIYGSIRSPGKYRSLGTSGNIHRRARPSQLSFKAISESRTM